jgi:hypothetical protein
MRSLRRLIRARRVLSERALVDEEARRLLEEMTDEQPSSGALGSPNKEPGAWRRRWIAAEHASGLQDWSVASDLWVALFKDTIDPKARRLAGRRAAMACRRAGELETAREIMTSLISEAPDVPATREELAKLEQSLSRGRARSGYWHDRERLLYVQVAKEICRRIASNANSIVDVGSNATPMLEWFPDVPLRVSVDMKRPYEAEGIEPVRGDFLEWNPGRTFDVGISLQVLEHVPDAKAFARHLLELCEVSIISVPYRWPEGSSTDRTHVHDPVDEAKLETWFGREPNYSYKIKELGTGDRAYRLICVYDRTSDRVWTNIDEVKFRFRWTLRGSERVILRD